MLPLQVSQITALRCISFSGIDECMMHALSLCSYKNRLDLKIYEIFEDFMYSPYLLMHGFSNQFYLIMWVRRTTKMIKSWFGSGNMTAGLNLCGTANRRNGLVKIASGKNLLLIRFLTRDLLQTIFSWFDFFFRRLYRIRQFLFLHDFFCLSPEVEDK